MVIGGLYGRTGPDQSDDVCAVLSRLYRERFLQSFGTVVCHELWDRGYGPDGKACNLLVERAIGVLLGVLEGGVPPAEAG